MDDERANEKILASAYSMGATRVDRSVVHVTDNSGSKNIRIAFMETSPTADPIVRNVVSMTLVDGLQLQQLLTQIFQKLEMQTASVCTIN